MERTCRDCDCTRLLKCFRDDIAVFLREFAAGLPSVDSLVFSAANLATESLLFLFSLLLPLPSTGYLYYWCGWSAGDSVSYFSCARGEIGVLPSNEVLVGAESLSTRRRNVDAVYSAAGRSWHYHMYGWDKKGSQKSRLYLEEIGANRERKMANPWIYNYSFGHASDWYVQSKSNLSGSPRCTTLAKAGF